jgi:hypothetical protein
LISKRFTQILWRREQIGQLGLNLEILILFPCLFLAALVAAVADFLVQQHRILVAAEGVELVAHPQFHYFLHGCCQMYCMYLWALAALVEPPQLLERLELPHLLQFIQIRRYK